MGLKAGMSINVDPFTTVLTIATLCVCITSFVKTLQFVCRELLHFLPEGFVIA